MLKEKLLHILPKQLRNDDVTKADTSKLDSFILDGIKSESVYRKIRSEAIRSIDHADNDLDDLRLRFEADQKLEDPYIRHLSNPCDVVLFTKEQISIAKSTKNANNGGLIWVDSTGSIVRKIQSINKQFYYYAISHKLSKHSCAATDFEIEAQKFITDASERYYNLYNKIAEETFSTNDDEDFEVVFSKFETVKKIAHELVQISQESSNFNLEKIQNARISNAIKNLRMTGHLFVLGENYFSSVLVSLTSLRQLSLDKDIEPYLNGANMPDQNGSPLAYYPDIKKIISSSSDAEELKYYWKTWREKNSAWSALHFYSIVEAFTKAAEILDVPILEFWYRYYDNKDFIVEMERVMNELKPSYKQLHAFMRAELVRKYGENVVDPNGPIPDHLFQQLVEQAWLDNSVIETYFPFKELPPYNEFVSKFNAKDLFKVADHFYTSLGFMPLDDKFRSNQLQEHSEQENEGNCRTAIFDMTPLVLVKYCRKVDFKSFIQAHGYVGRVRYAIEKKNLSASFFNSYDLEYPVGEAIILSASTPKHLSSIGLANNFEFQEETLNNRLIRMAIHTMFNIPLFYVHTRVMNDLLSGKIEIEALNRHYWQLMQNYVGVGPPTDREEGEVDFPDKFYLDMEENYQTKKFVSEILGYQMYRSFCKASGQVGQLHNCDFFGNLQIGSKLKNMMSLGSSKPWREVIAEVLPKNESLSADALLEYYAPILSWIKNENTASKVKIGWENTKMKVV